MNGGEDAAQAHWHENTIPDAAGVCEFVALRGQGTNGYAVCRTQMRSVAGLPR